MGFRKKPYKQTTEGDIEFQPTERMKLFAAYWFCHPQFKHLSEDELTKELGFRENIYQIWCDKFNPEFEEWLQSQKALFNKKESSKKAMLEYVGMNEATKGDFQFWKLLAQREGVISQDSINHNIIPVTLGEFNAFTPHEIEKHADFLLAALSPMEGKEEPLMVTGISEGEPKDNESGIVDLPVEPVEIS